VAGILTVNAQAVAAVVTAVILILAVCTSAENFFTYVAKVVCVLVNTLSADCFAYITNVVKIYVCSTL
jgi:hypothetical protein